MTICPSGGGQCEGRKILNREELTSLNVSRTNLLISSMYVPQIYQKARALGFQNIWVNFALLLSRDESVFRFREFRTTSYQEKLDALIERMEDEPSREYFRIMKATARTGKAVPEISRLYCAEPQYFLHALVPHLSGLSFFDAGAFIGDTLMESAQLGIRWKAAYAFEADQANFERCKAWAAGQRSFPVTVEHMALWDCEAKLSMNSDRFNAFVTQGESADMVDATSIDVYCADRTVDFVKMDIEGAEQHAIAGGWKTFERDRPVFAISIYHSLQDVVEVPQMMMERMSDYHWFVRHHAVNYCEVILYGIPDERWRAWGLREEEFSLRP